jgi:hypothetical protein
MRALIVLAILVAILQFGLKYFVTPPYGEDVTGRFIERSKFIPSIKAQKLAGNDGTFNISNLALWLAMPENAPIRRGYVTPVILPLDLLFLIALGSLLGWASSMLAVEIGLMSKFSPVIWWIFPLAYLLFDFVEDIFIAVILTWPSLLSPATFWMLTTATTGKLWAIGAAFLQVGLLLAGWLSTLLATFFK